MKTEIKDAYGKTIISKKAALKHVKKFGTGRQFRNMQMWSTRHECKTPEGMYYMVTIYDGNGSHYIQNGSDL